MHSQKKDTWLCPHCGNENVSTDQAWIGIMDGHESPRCIKCNRQLDSSSDSGHIITDKKENRNFNITFFLISLLLSGLMVYLNRVFNIFNFKKDWGHFAYEIIIILVISSALASGRFWNKFKHLFIWAIIFLIFLTGYSYRFELSEIKDKVMMEVVPSKGYQKSPDSISFPLSSDGHFYILAELNKVPIMFLADTGATSIVLSPRDAAKLGIKKSDLKFDRFYETANGNVRGSSIEIADLRIGEIHLKNIGASVNEAKMSNSLLGMSFFKRLKSYEVKNDVLTLYWGGNGE